MTNTTIRFATPNDVPLILAFIKALASYEKLAHEVVADEAMLNEMIFGEKRYAEVILAYLEDEPVGFALFFHNFSTFLGRPGLYLEDLFVQPHARGYGVGLSILKYLARLAKERKCGRFEWSVLDWNQVAIDFYERLGAKPMAGWTGYRLTDPELSELATA